MVPCACGGGRAVSRARRRAACRCRASPRSDRRQGGIGSVYDRHEYADENRKIMEAVAAKIIGIVEGKADPGNILPFAARAGAEAH
jgi:hypothetical protein